MKLTRRYLEFFKFGEREITQILEQQENSEKLSLFADDNAMLLMRVQEAERIIKLLKILVKDFHEGVSAKDVIQQLQKLLKK